LLKLLSIISIFVVNIYSLNINDKENFYEILSKSKVYVDFNKTKSFKEIQHNIQLFKNNNKKVLSFGYSPNLNLWINFILTNKSDESLDLALEYDNPLTTHIELYSSVDSTTQKDGVYQTVKNRRTLNPAFEIKLNAHESKEFFLKASSHITTLIAKMNLYKQKSFYEKEIKHQLILGLFFASMFVLGLYNLFIYFFTKDISYLYYVLYIFGVIMHQYIYVGMSNIYFFTHKLRVLFIEYSPLLVAFPIFFFGLFTKVFLGTKHYLFINNILNLFLIIIPISIVLFTAFDSLIIYRHIPGILLVIYLIGITIYLSLKNNRQAFFILFGWVIVLSSAILMYLSSIGIFDISQYQPYYIEISFVLEAFIFSIALADRMKQLKYEKNETTLLLRELNHRVKNNMQTIISLIRLQADEVEDEKSLNILTTIQNRINAMSHLHELLYKKSDISYVNAYEYFDILIDDIKQSYEKDIEIVFDIRNDLKIDQAIYCGLILNELVTNSYKHAFLTTKGNIYISLLKDKSNFKLVVKDNGIGYDINKPNNSLGIVLINTLVKEQLKGKIQRDTTDGVEVQIYWNNNG